MKSIDKSPSSLNAESPRTNEIRLGMRSKTLFVVLSLALSACMADSTPKSSTASRTTPIVATTPQDSSAEKNNDINSKYSEDLRPGIRLNVLGEDSHDAVPSSLSELNYNALEKGSSFSRSVIQLENDTNLAIVEIATDKSIDYKTLLKIIYSNSKTIISDWAKDAGVKENFTGRFVKGNHTITLSTAIIPAGDGDIYFPFAEYGDTNLLSFINLVKNHQRQVLSVKRGEGGYTMLSMNGDSSSLIGINIPANSRMMEMYRASGINLTRNQCIELIIVNEYATLFIEQVRRNNPDIYDKFIEELKTRYKFPPENNPKFEMELANLAKSKGTAVDKERKSKASESLTTWFTYNYMGKFMGK
ncbi:MAG: hypothetical protein WCK31_03335 [bacterium]